MKCEEIEKLSQIREDRGNVRTKRDVLAWTRQDSGAETGQSGDW